MPTIQDKEAVRQRTNFHAFYERELGRKLDFIKDNGDAMTLCPLHEDSDPSLAVNVHSGVFKCHGCGAGGDIFRFVEMRYKVPFTQAVKYVDQGHMGCMEPSPAQRTVRKNTPVKKKDSRPQTPAIFANCTGTYAYYDQDGHFLYYVFRFEKSGHRKNFRPGFFTEDGELVLKMPPGVKRTLYNLHRPDEYLDSDGGVIRGLRLDSDGVVIWPPSKKAVNLSVTRSSLVYLVEGEKCAEALLTIGLCATTSGSAETWRSDLAPLLAGKTVIIIPDNDEPGEKYAIQAAKDLVGVAASVRIQRLDGLQPGQDIADWITQRGDACRTM